MTSSFRVTIYKDGFFFSNTILTGKFEAICYIKKNCFFFISTDESDHDSSFNDSEVCFKGVVLYMHFS